MVYWFSKALAGQAELLALFHADGAAYSHLWSAQVASTRLLRP